MTIEQKLEVHLLDVVMPIGVRLNADQQLELCRNATLAQRQQALQLSLVHIPYTLEEEMEQAWQWVDGGCPGCGFSLVDHQRGCPSPGNDGLLVGHTE
jgi:hypothetical protein